MPNRFCFLVALACAFASFSCSSTSKSGNPALLIVQGSGIRVRQQPGETSAEAGRMNFGDRIALLHPETLDPSGPTPEWIRIRRGKAVEGWVGSKWVLPYQTEKRAEIATRISRAWLDRGKHTAAECLDIQDYLRAEVRLPEAERPGVKEVSAQVDTYCSGIRGAVYFVGAPIKYPMPEASEDLAGFRGRLRKRYAEVKGKNFEERSECNYERGETLNLPRTDVETAYQMIKMIYPDMLSSEPAREMKDGAGRLIEVTHSCVEGTPPEPCSALLIQGTKAGVEITVSSGVCTC